VKAPNPPHPPTVDDGHPQWVVDILGMPDLLPHHPRMFALLQNCEIEFCAGNEIESNFKIAFTFGIGFMLSIHNEWFELFKGYIAECHEHLLKNLEHLIRLLKLTQQL